MGGVTIESYGEIVLLQEKILCWSDWNETAQEWSLGCVVVPLGFEIFKMVTVAMVALKIKLVCWSDCNEASQ